MNQSEARSLFWVSHVGSGAYGLEPSSMDSPCGKQGIELEVEQPGYKSVPVWNDSATGND